MKLILGVHNHQPVGNFDHVIADVYQKSYLPFMEHLEEHPQIRLCMHHTGPLWEWLEIHRPEYLDRMQALVLAGRLEILGGAFYEPILPAIPESDRIGQLRLMSEKVKERFGTEARGMWLAERVWEPHLSSSLAAAGVTFVMLDDYHFIQSGLMPEELTDRPLLTEDLGATLALFPISEQLRYLIPFQEPEQTVALCRTLHEQDPGGMLVMVDDGEKFGAWPETYDWVYERGWLQRFFTALAAESEWLELATPSEALAARPPRQRVYLPPGSYFEMSEWALPVPAAEKFHDLVQEAKQQGRWPQLRPFLRGGFWRQFLQRYDESALMYHRALLLHEDIRAAEETLTEDVLAVARRELWRAQCNCAYWHGVFGGLYLPHLRHAIFAHLIRGTALLRADRDGDASAARQAAGVAAGSGIQAASITGAPHWELRLTNPRLEVFVAPARGGAIVALEDCQGAWNLQNTLRRRREAYHRKIESSAAPQGADSDHASIHDRMPEVSEQMRQALAEDAQSRFSLLDRMIHLDAHADDLLHDVAGADGGDFAEAPYALRSPAEPLARDGNAIRGWTAPGDSRLICERAGCYRDRAGRTFPIGLCKEIRLAPDRAVCEVGWRLRNAAEQEVAFRFAPEWNLALLEHETYLEGQNQARQKIQEGEWSGCQRFALAVPHYGARLVWTFKAPCEIWLRRVRTVSQAESGFELNYQGHLLVPSWVVRLAPGEQSRLGLTFMLDRI